MSVPGLGEPIGEISGTFDTNAADEMMKRAVGRIAEAIKEMPEPRKEGDRITVSRADGTTGDFIITRISGPRSAPTYHLQSVED